MLFEAYGEYIKVRRCSFLFKKISPLQLLAGAFNAPKLDSFSRSTENGQVGNPPKEKQSSGFSISVGTTGTHHCQMLGFPVRRQRDKRSVVSLVASLAVADLMTSFTLLPFPVANTMPQNWVGQLYCKAVKSHSFLWTTIVASIFTLATMSVDRYLAICRPIIYKRLMTTGRVRCSIVAIWLTSMLINVDNMVVFRVDEYCKCGVHYSSMRLMATYGVIVFLVQFIAPTVIMLVTHFLTARSLDVELARFDSRPKNRRITCGPTARLLLARKRNTTSLLIIVLTFIVCWGPHQISFLLFNLGMLSPTFLSSEVHEYFVILAFFNSCVNPLIYTIRYPKFRAMLTSKIPFPARERRSARLPAVCTHVTCKIER
ncbi:nociceptin receptor-like [Diadema antillarum]|uniref:nociceptin receptor-like n=1 Tax=Diadema antillarum TaxID=105358 RepID=UPI003A8B36F5